MRSSDQLKTQHSKLLIANSSISCHTNISEVFVCIHTSAIKRFYDEQGNETEMVDFQIAVRRKCMPTVNKQVKILTSQYIGTCKIAYTKGYVLN